MKKTIFILVLAAFSLSISSCLKDKPNTDFSGIGTVIELPYAGLQYFSSDAITDTGNTVVRKFGINIASAKPLSTATNYTIAVNNALLTAYDQANTGTLFLPMPAGSYTISKLSGTIPAGQRLDSVTVTFDKTKLDPSKSYLLPIALVSASNGILSGNFNAHYYHFIGNDFAGAWRQTFRRWSAVTDSTTAGTLYSGSFAGNSATFVPVSPTEFVVYTGYDGDNVIHYDVNFTKNSNGTYSNFTVALLAADVSAVSGSIAFPQAPVFLSQPGGTSLGSTIAGPLTLAQAQKAFNFQFIAQTSAARYIVDYFYK
jgi:hypothetical protein